MSTTASISDSRQTQRKTGTREWAERNLNIQTGCENGCLYCYASSMAIRFGRSTPETWPEPRIRQHELERIHRKREGITMFPSTHDITPFNLKACLQVLRSLLRQGNHVLIVSKPHLACIKVLCRELAAFRELITFRFTIGSASDQVLGFWESNASGFAERLACLRYAFKHSYSTSVSCEPMLDAHIDKVIAAVTPYVTQTIWLGRANRLRQIIAVNAPGNEIVRARADDLIATWNDDAIMGLYQRFNKNPRIRFKDSIKKVVGVQAPLDEAEPREVCHSIANVSD